MKCAIKSLLLRAVLLTFVTTAFCQTAADYSNSGIEKEDSGDFDGAIADYNKAIELKPDDGYNYSCRAIARRKKGDFDGAIADYTKAIDLKTDKADDYNSRGAAKQEKGDLAGAIADLTKAVELKPDDDMGGEAHWFLGCLLYDSQDFTNALVQYRKSVELDDTYDNSRFRIWLIRARSDEKDAAAKELQIYLDNRTKENLGDWHYKIGSFLADQLTESDFLDAAANFDSAKDLGTSAGRLCEAYFYAGSKRLFAGDKDIAADDFEKSIATNQKGYQEYFSAAAELKFLQAEKIQAEKLSVLEATAEAQAKTNDIAGALKTADLLQDMGTNQEWKSRALVVIAEAQADAGDIAGAFKTTDLIQKAGWKDPAFSSIAGAQAEGKDMAGAFKTIGQIQNSDQKDWGLSGVAHVQLNSGDIAGALKTVDLIQNQTMRDTVLSPIAEAQAKVGDIDGAQKTANLIKGPDAIWKSSALAAIAEAKARLRVAEPAVIPQTNAVALITADDYVKSGVAKYYQGDVDGSIADFTKAIELKPDSADAYNKRAIAKFKKSDVDGSIADLSQAITLNPNNALAYYDRGIARKSKHEYDGAIADYNRAIQLDPNNPDAYIRLAWILSTCPQAGSRDGKKAVAAATKACELSGWKVPAMLDTLAAACAEAGDFDSAVKWEGKYRETPNLGASEDARTEVVLGAYQAHLPYRESN